MSTLDLGVHARCVCAVPSVARADGDEPSPSSSSSRFFTATNTLRGENKLIQVEFTPETKTCATTTSIALEHRCCETVDVDETGTHVVVTYEDAGRETKRVRGVATAAVGERDGASGTPTDLRLDDASSSATAKDVEEFETVKCARLNRVTGTLVTVDEFKARVWRRRDDGAFASASSCATRVDQSRSEIIGGMNTMQDGVAQGAWDPHSADAFACGVDADVVVFDARTASRAQTIEKAHAQQTRDVRYNPNKPHEMMSCGDDGLLKMWDARAHERPLKVVAGHEHWIWNCAYNPVYDALTLSAGSDGTVRLWCDDDALPSDSHSASRADARSGIRAVSRRVVRADSVSARACAWSAADPWTYAVVTADGSFTALEVPREEKYRILL